MIAFIDDHRAAYGVEPICRVLPIAPSKFVGLANGNHALFDLQLAHHAHSADVTSGTPLTHIDSTVQ